MSSCRQNTEISINIPTSPLLVLLLLHNRLNPHISLLSHSSQASVLTDTDRSWQTVGDVSSATVWLRLPGLDQLSSLHSAPSSVCQEIQTLSNISNITILLFPLLFVSYLPQIIQEHKDLIFRTRVSTKFEVLLNLQHLCYSLVVQTSDNQEKSRE